MTDFPNVRRVLQEATPYLRAADEVLAAVHRAREGSVFSGALAVAAGVGAVLRAALPRKTPFEILASRGYQPIRTTLGAFFCKLLTCSDLPRRVEENEDRERIVFWSLPLGQDHLAAIYHQDAWIMGPFALKGDRAALGTALLGALTADSALSCTTATSENRVDVGHSEKPRDFELTPMQPPGVYLGEPDLEWFVERLKRHGTETRSMLLVGPTGVGKSTLGRLIAANVIENSAGKLLKISANAMRECSAADLVDLVTFLAPSVLLLDDLSQLHFGGESCDQILEVLEAIHGRARLVIGTLMSDSEYQEVPRPGDGESYFSGMRPGRIDEIVRVKRPSPRVRGLILRHYTADMTPALTDKFIHELVCKTEGLTGAYLAEIAHRLKVHGVSTWKSEVASVRAASPFTAHRYRTARRSLARARRRRGK